VVSKLFLQRLRLTFHPEVGGAADALGRDEISGALAGVVGVVDDPVQLPAGPLVEVEVEGRRHRLEVVLGEVGRLLALADGVALVVVANVRAVLEPDDVAERGALHLALQGEVSDLSQKVMGSNHILIRYASLDIGAQNNVERLLSSERQLRNIPVAGIIEDFMIVDYIVIFAPLFVS